MFIRPPGARRFPPRGLPVQNPPQRPQVDDSDDEQAENQFYPVIFDVLKVRYILLWKVKPEGLPTEVADMIIDAAEYWPSTEATLEGGVHISKDKDQALIYTAPLCYDEKTLDSPSPKLLPHRTVHPCRKILFTITSHDQGGYTERRLTAADRPPVYDSSFTWFDAEMIHKAHEPSQQRDIHEKMHPEQIQARSFVPNDPLLLPRGNALQRNRARNPRAKRHRVVWHHLDDVEAGTPEVGDLERETGRGRDTFNGEQVRTMEIGDSIVVWARARFPGWTNHVDELSVRVFWVV